VDRADFGVRVGGEKAEQIVRRLAFPIARLAERLRCPKCGCRRTAVVFDAPTDAGFAAGRISTA
jgi:hypothetical protein